MKIGHIIVPVQQLDAQISFYESLGLSMRFRDGDRYAGMTDGTTTIGLADSSQQPVAGRIVLSIEVDDLDAALARLGKAEMEIVQGPHERRALVSDAAGNPVAIYERTAH